VELSILVLTTTDTLFFEVLGKIQMLD